jgi:hypothetical protein
MMRPTAWPIPAIGASCEQLFSLGAVSASQSTDVSSSPVYVHLAGESKAERVGTPLQAR